MSPFDITIHPEADGGPEHLLYLLRDFVVDFRKQGRSVVTGAISKVDNDTVTVLTWNEAEQLHNGTPMTLNIFGNDFDEVMYL